MSGFGAAPRLEVLGVPGIGEVAAGDDLVGLLADAADLRDGDVLVVASKVVAKAEGRTVAAHPEEAPDDARRRLASQEEVLVDTPHVLVVRTALGHVCANAGIDASNVPGGDLLLLPADPDASAAALRRGLRERAGVDVGVVVSDTFGRAWREGQTDVALGVSGLAALRDERGATDRQGATLRVTLVALADQVAGAADLVRDKAAGLPAVIVRGLPGVGGDDLDGGGAALVRPPCGDLFPHGRGWLLRRLATGAGAPVRRGAPPAQEWAQVMRLAPGARRDGLRLLVEDGLAAGRVEAALLDLGYDVVLEGEGPWSITVRPADPAVGTGR